MIYSIFKNKVELFSGHTGFVLEDGRRLTYAQADLIVENIALYLSSLGVKQGDRVGVILEFESLHPFIFYALDKLNASYVPFDLNMPEGQLREDVEKLGLSRLIGPDNLLFKKGEWTGYSPDSPLRTVLALCVGADQDRYSGISALQRDNSIPTYLVASSGTSGNKKWMGIKGAGLGYWEKTEEIQLDLKPGHKVLCTRSPGYDARISEYLRALIAGGELHLISRDQRRDLDFIIHYCKENKITEILLIASQLNLDNIESIIQQLAEGGLKNLIVTGDACRPKLQALCEQVGISLINAYGPTEACFGVSLKVVNGRKLLDEQGHPVVPIGLPFGVEIKIHLINERVYIESPYLIDGYIDNPEATSKMFKIIDIGDRPTRVFDTGDRADLVDGKLRFKGRLDSSDDCKINGVKVDKQDIENKLIRLCSEDPLFTHAVVVSKVVSGETRLVAYLVTQPGFDAWALNNRLVKELLPEQIPSLMSLSKLPIMTVSQKIDKQVLIARVDSPDEYYLFSSPLATDPVQEFDDPLILKLRSLWEEILGINNFRNDVSFSVVGGKSFDLTRLVAKIRKEINPAVTMLDLLKLRDITIESIHQLLAQKRELVHGPVIALVNLLSGSFDPKKKNLYILPHLLGDGYFSYKNLAETILANRQDVNIWGLSDPGIHEEMLIDKTDKQMIDQYVTAIIQNEKKVHKFDKVDVCLAGFSYGCFLAYRVALGLAENGNIRELHLIDGFPPLYFQKQTLPEHAELLLNFYQFIGGILNGELYGERIDLKKDLRINALDKISQVEAVFNSLLAQSKNPASHRILRVAKQHLIHMLNHRNIDMIHVPVARLYFSNPDQVFFKVLSQLPDSQYKNQTKTFGYWDNYLKNMTKCSSISQFNHLDLINEKSGSSTFFAYNRYRMESQPERDYCRLEPLVYVEKNEKGLFNITACHLSLRELHNLRKWSSDDSFLKNSFLNSREFEYSIKTTVSEFNEDVRSIMESGITMNAEDESDADEIVNLIELVCMEDIVRINQSGLLQNSWDVMCQNRPELFSVKVIYFNEAKHLMEMVYQCKGNKDLLHDSLVKSHLPANAKIENLRWTLRISFYCFSDEAILRGKYRVDELLQRLTPQLLPYVIASHEKVLPIVDEFFGLQSELEISPPSLTAVPSDHISFANLALLRLQ